MLANFLGVLPILISPLCALALSCDQSPILLLCLPLKILLTLNCGALLLYADDLKFLVFAKYWASLEKA
jgi:hypothetical protein